MRKKVRIYIIKLDRKRRLMLLFIISLILITIFLRSFKVLKIFSHKGGNKIVIDPGHGGIDGGAGDREILLEKDINLDVSLKLKKELEKEGFNVIMTREKDESLEEFSNINASRYRKDLDARKTIVNENDPLIFVSVHANTSKKSSVRGIQVYYYPMSNESKKLAESICEAVNRNVYKDFLKDDNIKAVAIPKNYFILRETENTGVLVEVGFMTNPDDMELLQNNKYKKKVAESIKNGILQHIQQ